MYFRFLLVSNLRLKSFHKAIKDLAYLDTHTHTPINEGTCAQLSFCIPLCAVSAGVRKWKTPLLPMAKIGSAILFILQPQMNIREGIQRHQAPHHHRKSL